VKSSHKALLDPVKF